MKDIDEEISKVISAKIYEPEGYKNAIETALYKENIKSPKTYFYKMIAIVCCCLILLSGVVYASYSIIKNVFNNRKGVETAISNNYIMDGLQEYQESNGVAVKINNILMDDYNLDISFNVKFDKEIEIDNSNEFQFEKMIILDEESRILFYEGSQTVLEDFIEKYKLNIKIDKLEYYTNISKSTHTRNKSNNQLDLIYNISAYGNEYPRSKEINIYAENLILNESTNIKGDWQIKQKMDEKFYNREKIVYHCKDIDYENIISVEATTYSSGTNITIETKNNKQNSNNNLKEVLLQINKQAKNEISSNNANYNNGLLDVFMKSESYKIFNDIYIENSNKVKFYPTKNFNESAKILNSENQDNIIFFDILDMTIYDCTKELKLHFSYYDKEYDIKLVN